MKKTSLLASVCAALLQACAPVSSPGEGSSTMSTTASSSRSALSLPAYYWRLASATDASGKAIPALQRGIEQPLRLSFSASASVRDSPSMRHTDLITSARGALPVMASTCRMPLASSSRQTSSSRRRVASSSAAPRNPVQAAGRTPAGQ